jgi:hypothetical protein
LGWILYQRFLERSRHFLPIAKGFPCCKNMYEKLPIFRDSLKLNAYVEEAVKNFSRYNKYGIGSELRENSREILYSIPKIYLDTKENRLKRINELRFEIEKLKTKIYLANELKVLRDFKQFEILSGMAHNLSQQAGGWFKSQSQNHGGN